MDADFLSASQDARLLNDAVTSMRATRDLLLTAVREHERFCPGNGQPCLDFRCRMAGWLIHTLGLRGEDIYGNILQSVMEADRQCQSKACLPPVKAAPTSASAKTADKPEALPTELPAEPPPLKTVAVPTTCPHCQHSLAGYTEMANQNAAAALAAGRQAVAVCPRCAGVVLIGPGAIAHIPTQDEYDRLRRDPRWSLVDIVRDMIRQSWAEEANPRENEHGQQGL